MKKLMVAALTMSVMVAFGGEFADFGSSSYEAVDGAFRVKLGGFGRGGVKTTMDGLGSDRGEAYGADIDFQYNALSTDSFNLWAGIGGAFTPNQSVAKNSYYEYDSDGTSTQEMYGDQTLNLGYGELRFMLEPEYKITERWAIGLRTGVALDWLRMKGKATIGGRTTIDNPGFPPMVIPFGPESESAECSRFAAQGIIGFQTSYMICDNVGLYGAIDYRGGNDVTFKKGGEKLGTVDMSGWYWGAGLVYQF